MRLRWIWSGLALMVVASVYAYALPFELALVMAGDVMTYLEIVAGIYLLSRTGPMAGAWTLVKGVTRDCWEKLQLTIGAALARSVPDLPPPRVDRSA
jgi:hypothetical protein